MLGRGTDPGLAVAASENGFTCGAPAVAAGAPVPVAGVSLAAGIASGGIEICFDSDEQPTTAIVRKPNPNAVAAALRRLRSSPVRVRTPFMVIPWWSPPDWKGLAALAGAPPRSQDRISRTGECPIFAEGPNIRSRSRTRQQAPMCQSAPGVAPTIRTPWRRFTW
jgi:hypothetical protein